MALCVVCKAQAATVPDRDRGGKLINKLCQGCHVARLREDLERGLQQRAAKRQEAE